MRVSYKGANVPRAGQRVQDGEKELSRLRSASATAASVTRADVGIAASSSGRANGIGRSGIVTRRALIGPGLLDRARDHVAA